MGKPRDYELPNPGPRPEGEEARLLAIWKTPTGWRLPTAVNNTVIGLLYIGAAFVFFVLAGVLALIMRTQLAVPESELVSQTFYNQLFTVHGTTMMFLFAVPAVEALGVMLLPQMMAARDLPFPRLSAFAIWAYIVGGTVFFSTIFYDLAPMGGWFMNPPLTLMEYSPGDNSDFWLLGIGFIEISAIAGAIEIIVGTLRTRPPGMTLWRMPIFAWAMLVFAVMIVVAFPAVILATMLLEIERAFGWPFFTAALGGDALLWQHLFWFFGHPEVYIIFLPAAGLVSMIVSTVAQRPLVGYRLIVVALVATGFFSFGLWVHHMFATGIPALSLTFFSAASMAVAIPSGIQLFAWVATLASARKDRIRLGVPGHFVLGMLAIFTIGGLTGVMVAMVPFDWQAHDSYFIVAHLHYVLIGGMVFPLFATFYYWAPVVSRTLLSERLGKLAFWLMFIGVNVTFLPMHVTGLAGMPRRVWTYSEASGWELLNLVSTVGAYVIAAGVAVFIIDVIRNFRYGEGGPDNPWNAGTLEFLPQDVYSTRSIPLVTSQYPLWEQRDLPREVRDGQHFLPNAPTGGRETIVTSPIDARPQYVIQMPGPGWSHVLAAVFMAACFLLLTIKVVIPALVCAVVAIGGCLHWVWELDKGPDAGPVDIGGGYRLPVYVTGPDGHGWWAMVVLMLVGGSLYIAYVFSYLYLWTVSPEVWPTTRDLPGLGWPLASVLCLVIAIVGCRLGKRSLAPPGESRNALTPAWVALSALAMIAALVIEGVGQWTSGVRPDQNSHDAMVFMEVILSGQLAAAILVMSGFVIARHYAGKLDRVRWASLENTQLLLYYTVGQAMLGLLLVHGFPRLLE